MTLNKKWKGVERMEDYDYDFGAIVEEMIGSSESDVEVADTE